MMGGSLLSLRLDFRDFSFASGEVGFFDADGALLLEGSTSRLGNFRALLT